VQEKKELKWSARERMVEKENSAGWRRNIKIGEVKKCGEWLGEKKDRGGKKGREERMGEGKRKGKKDREKEREKETGMRREG
jgi:hypothetical protein